jgi:hypothetical protein
MRPWEARATSCLFGVLFSSIFTMIAYGDGAKSTPYVPGLSRSAAGSNPPAGQTRDRRDKLLEILAVWLASEFRLPSLERQPQVAFLSGAEMNALRYRADSLPEHAGNVVALYGDEIETVFLSDAWNGSTGGELSVLVHELTHHVQNVSDMKFRCPEEREKLAYEAQDRWLALFQGDLEEEFQIDAFTLLIQTNCLY